MSASEVRVRARLVPTYALLGLIGSAALAIASHRVGALKIPDGVPFGSVNLGAVNAKRPRELYFAGLALLVLAWLGLGRLVLSDAVPWRTVRRVGWLWAVPLLAAMPLGSRDVWAYVGQADVAANGFDPYTVTPAAARVPLLLQVDPIWRNSTSPYGPVWTVLGRFVLWLGGGNLDAVVILFRLTIAVGLLLISLALPRLCRVAGGRADAGLWLVCANPFTLLVCLAGAHNDVLMAGLIAAGLWLAVIDVPAWIGLGGSTWACVIAADIKAPALIVCAFLPAIWLAYSPSGQAWRQRRFAFLRVNLMVAALTVIGLGFVGVVSGYGIGWARRFNAVATGTAWLSLPVALHSVVTFVQGGSLNPNAVSPRYRLHTQEAFTTKAALLIVLIILAVLWALSSRRSPLVMLTLALVATVVSSTSIQPWYAFWPLLTLGTIPLTRLLCVRVAAASIAVCVSMQTFGGDQLSRTLGLSLSLIAILSTYALLRNYRTTPAALVREVLHPPARADPPSPSTVHSAHTVRVTAVRSEGASPIVQ